ncbi:caltractin, putative [Entamoeba invadens IP1]|uniref:Caltractin, putative n=1 Tax=Entamoeba invadens IP1 TaxID=370355 RepID=A0A0A1U566_ENTIV|nr:caltractin, putative [Entamoeba invadens IP1]ELP88002.1 caltractin, putative [Entamoeba invadens IP1]|eukprot:XP_004254773.1 caltractin, putative [Entamoeba invadens IP1]
MDAGAIFDSFDSDHSGFIDTSEFLNGMKKYTGLGDEYDEKFTFMFQIVDGVGAWNAKDGKLNKSEFQRICNAMPNGITDKHKMVNIMIYNLVDQDHNGSVSKEELKNFLRILNPNYSDKDADKIAGLIDTDGDGSISKDEFLMIMR